MQLACTRNVLMRADYSDLTPDKQAESKLENWKKKSMNANANDRKSGNSRILHLSLLLEVDSMQFGKTR